MSEVELIMTQADWNGYLTKLSAVFPDTTVFSARTRDLPFLVASYPTWEGDDKNQRCIRHRFITIDDAVDLLMVAPFKAAPIRTDKRFVNDKRLPHALAYLLARLAVWIDATQTPEKPPIEERRIGLLGVAMGLAGWQKPAPTAPATPAPAREDLIDL